MKVDPYLHAALVLHGAGKDISKDNLVSVLKAAGAEADDAKAKVLAEAVSGVDFEELLKNAAVPSAAPAAAAPAAAEGGEEKEEKKEESAEDSAKKEEEAAEGLASLFG